MDAFAHQFVDLSSQRILGKHCALSVYHCLVVSNGGACLGFPWVHFTSLCRRFLNEWKQELEVQTIALQDVCCQSITVVGEVTCKDGCQMKLTAMLAVEHGDMTTYRCCNALGNGKRLIVRCLDKERDAGEVYLSLLGERLHGVYHPVVCYASKCCSRDRTGGVEYRAGEITTLGSVAHYCQLGCQRGDGIILHRHDDCICRGLRISGNRVGEGANVISWYSSYLLGKSLSRSHRSAIHSPYVMAFGIKGLCQLGGQPSCSYEY